jgi:hypothetical protein
VGLSPSNLTSGHAQGASIGNFVTASVSPSANALLVLGAAGFDGAGAQDFTITGVSGLGLTWTRQKLGVAGATPKGDVEAWTAVCGASPGSGAITATLSSATVNGGVAWSVDQFTGEDTTTPVIAGNIVAGNNSSAASSVTYGTAASSQNLFWFLSVVLIGTGQSVTQAASETPAWTQLAQAQSDTTSQNGVSVQAQVSPDATVLTGSSSWTGSHSWGTVGLEIAAASGGPTFSGTGNAAASLAVSGTATSARSGSGHGVITLAASAAGAARKSGTGTAVITLAAAASPPPGTASAGQGSWYDLLAIRQANRQFRQDELSRPPLSCPNDGTPLEPSPPGWDSSLFCPHDGYRWPTDPNPLRPGGL